MRKVIYGGATSLDNYLARPDDSVDWLMFNDEVTQLIAEYWKDYDTMLYGRRTYEVAQKMGPGGGASPGMKNYVFSRTLKKVAKGFELAPEPPGAFVDRLKRQEGKDICVMGGGILAKSLFEADVIDEIGFNIHPVLLGSGIPAFHVIDKQIDLELKECRTLKNGCVVVTYTVKR